ncbi:hypothetical protein P8452_25822 [Trifolium repens]|jgi:hypothetical protein|nr:hypothetical protein P8452_25822 [Trifolium repens]
MKRRNQPRLRWRRLIQLPARLAAAVLDSDHHQLVKSSTSTTTAAKKPVKRPKLGIIKCPLGNTKKNKKNKN